MPYKVKGSAVYHKKGNMWVKRQQCGSPEKAKAAMRLLEGVKSGEWKPTGAPAKG